MTPPTISLQDHYDYDYDELDIFPTGLTPDLNWINLDIPVPIPLSTPGAGACPTDLARFNVLNLSVPDGSWNTNMYESSRSASSTPTPTATSTPGPHASDAQIPPKRPSISTSTSSPPTPDLNGNPSESEILDDVFQFIATVPETTASSPDADTQQHPLHPKSTSSAPSPEPASKTPGTGRVTKRQLNTEAARRYRQRKVDRMNQLEEELEMVKREREQLRMKVSKLVGETEGLKRLLDLRRE
ncbi:hypothetical protein BDV12DRAFT_197013 [Aspergillus spectabilis]